MLLHLCSGSAAIAANEPKIVVSPLIHGGVFADLDVSAHLELSSPPQAGGLVFIVGLPKSVTLSAGTAVAPGVWEVPLAALADLKMVVRASAPIKSDLHFLLMVKNRGLVLLDSARSVLIIDDSTSSAQRQAAAKSVEEERLAASKRAEDARKGEETIAAEQTRQVAAKKAEDERLAAARLAEDARKADEASAAEQTRQAAAKKAEDERLAAARLAEDARKAEEARAAEQTRQAAAKKAEDERLAAARLVEDARKADEARAAEQTRQAAAKKAEDERSAAVKLADNARKAENAPRKVEPVSQQPPQSGASANHRLVNRGDEQLGLGNVVVARQYYLRAAQAGLAAAAFKLAETHDPYELVRLNVQGLMPDLAEAKRWYAKALHLGVPEAKTRLSRLGD